MASQFEPLSAAALRLRNASPEMFEYFIKVFEAYSNDVTVKVTESSPAEILVWQGRAQQCRALLRVLKECDQVASRKPPTP